MIRRRAACRAFTLPRLSKKRLCGPVFFNAHTKDIIMDERRFVKSEKSAFHRFFPVDKAEFPLYNNFNETKIRRLFS